MIDDMIKIFDKANDNLLNNDISLFNSKVAERTLCGALMLHMYNEIKKSQYRDYYIDVEYNRNKNGKLKLCVKTIKGLKEKIIKINCDLIVHSRGENIKQDNLIAIEMKKSYRSKEDKENDKARLKALTKESYDDIWSFDGTTLPEHVCRYVLGVYYEINYKQRYIYLEYYKKGHCFDDKKIRF